MTDAMIISKVKNIYIMLLSAIMSEKIEKVDHFLDDNLTEHFRQIVETNIKNDIWQRYDQLNITNVEIVQNSAETVSVRALVRYFNYKVNKQSNKIVAGSDSVMEKNEVLLTFKKKEEQNKFAHKCPKCGAPLNLNQKSFCDYCGMPVDERYSELVLCEIY